MKKPTGYILYAGPSMLDGKPIVAIATVSTSENAKTGAMIQTFIMAADEEPTKALKSGADSSVCGDCKARPMLGGACYVNVGQAPLSVYRKWKRGGYPTISGYALTQIGSGRVVRLGSYGDPMAVPASVWQHLVLFATGHTGYTHQWANAAIPAAQRDAINALCMASVDNADEAVTARSYGLRYFRVRAANEAVGTKEAICPASEEAGKRLTCVACKACSGTKRPGQASITIVAHGPRKGRFQSAA